MFKTGQALNGIFHDKEFYFKMLKLSLPVMIQNLILSFLNMIDTVMVGKLGETEIAAVGIANQYFFFFNMFLIGVCAGCSVFIAQYWGKRDITNIKRILGVGLVSTTVVSLAFMILGFFKPQEIIALFNKDSEVIDLGSRYLKVVLASYIFTGITFMYNFSLRSVGNAVQPMVISFIALLCNAFLNYVFIFGKFGAPVMGVGGAALATVIARVIETTVLVVSIYYSRGVLAASIKELTDINLNYIKRAYQTILPVILNDTCWGLASLVYSAVYGRMGTQAVASIQICNTIFNLFMVAAFGLSSATAVMVGNSIGAGEEELGRDYARRYIILSVLVGVLLGLSIAVASPLMLGFFNVSETVKRSSQAILYISSVTFFIRVLDVILIVGILRGGGDATRALIIEGATMWFIGVPLSIIGAFVLRLPVHGVYALTILEEIAKCILSIMRVKSGKWINDVT
ncbi:MAG TPA: MATE family efflux transporter [Clostridiaceae bacterium]|nr:MATE family efflux transporter [Clostridiaceae bacterium]